MKEKHASKDRYPRRQNLRRWIIASVVAAFSLMVLNAVLVATFRFPVQQTGAGTSFGFDFTDFLIVTAAPIFLWILGFNTFSVWSMRKDTARMAGIMNRWDHERRQKNSLGANEQYKANRMRPNRRDAA